MSINSDVKSDIADMTVYQNSELQLSSSPESDFGMSSQPYSLLQSSSEPCICTDGSQLSHAHCVSSKSEILRQADSTLEPLVQEPIDSMVPWQQRVAQPNRLDSDSRVTSSRCFLSVEVTIFMYTLASGLSGSIVTQLLLVRHCQNLFPGNSSHCSLLEDKTDSLEARQLEALVQPHVSMLQMYKTTIDCALPVVLSMFLGPWSDLYGRKPLIIWPLFGYGIAYVLLTFLSAIPHLGPDYFLLSSLPVALSGGLVTIISGSLCYITDTTTEKRRSLRMGIFEAALLSGFVVGTYTCAPLFLAAGQYGYVTVFACSATFALLGFLYGVYIPESVNVIQKGNSVAGLCTLFDSEFIVRMVSTCCKRREQYGRAILFLIIITTATCIITMEGESNISFLYTREKFEWNLSKYTRYSSISMVTVVLGGLVGMYIFSVWLKISDSLFAACIFITKCLQTLIYGLAPKDWYMYLGSTVGIFGGVVGPLCRTIISKTVPGEDTGSAFALTSLVEALTPLAASPLYTFVYKGTFLIFPGTAYMLSAAIFVLDVILMSVVIVLQGPYTRQERDSEARQNTS
ncbi:probable peptidoglycan muropeptide transporter SLC46 isoform X1 [Periplaneta americana]|uniref:probable peptidoglycan muropeptide transporter SLC46 isoform X1 n=1 Tax=Periplaneta americana TaxID=6978 RepID=UPI0037E99EF8